MDDIDQTDPDYPAFRSDWAYVYGESNCDMSSHDFSLWKWSRNREREACLAAVAGEAVEQTGDCDHAYNMALRHAGAAIRARGAR